MITAFEHELRLFTPAAAERITGVSVALQRDWRRRGILPQHEGHARFKLFDLAELLFLRMMTDRGIGPLAQTGAVPVKGMAKSVAVRIVMHALRWPDAWEGPVERTPGRTWGEQAATLIGEMMSFDPARFFVWFADGSMVLCDDPREAFDRHLSSDPAVAGAVIVLDLNAIGSHLIEQVGEPLVTVTRLEVREAGA